MFPVCPSRKHRRPRYDTLASREPPRCLSSPTFSQRSRPVSRRSLRPGGTPTPRPRPRTRRGSRARRGRGGASAPRPARLLRPPARPLGDDGAASDAGACDHSGRRPSCSASSRCSCGGWRRSSTSTTPSPRGATTTEAPTRRARLQALTNLGNIRIVVGLALLLVVVDFYRCRSRWPFLFLLTVLAGTEVSMLVVKDLVGRLRPTLNPAAVSLGPSFPSGHSATAAAFYAAAALVIGA